MKDSTTLRLDVDGNRFFLDCKVGETIEVGSAPDCKLSLDAKGIQPRHCLVERLQDGEKFLVFTKNPKTKIEVNGVEANRMEVRSPFKLGVEGYKISFELVSDSEAEGFEEVEIETPKTGLHTDSPLSSRRSAIPAIRFRSTNGGRQRSSFPKPPSKLPPIPDWRKIATQPRKAKAPIHHEEPLREISAQFFRRSLAVVALIVGLGLGWFEWRERTLIRNPNLLKQKADSGNEYAQATLGFSNLFGEWNSPVNFDNARKLLFEDPGIKHPLAIYGSAFFREQGYFANPEPELTRQEIKKALDNGMIEEAGNSSDPRFKTLAGIAEFSVLGDGAKNSLSLLESAARSEYPLAAFTLADWAESGHLGLPEENGDIVDYWRRAERIARKAAKKNSALAQTLLGQIHLGEKIPESAPAVGVEYLEKAAEAGFPPAQFHLAQYLVEKNGATAENSAAKKWMFDAAGNGYVEARGGLAEMIYLGVGEKKNPEFALNEIARSAARDGSQIAAKLLAMHSLDQEESLLWAVQLASDGDRDGAFRAGEISRSRGQTSEAIGYFRKAASSKHPRAMIALAELLMSSPEDRDFGEADQWLHKAAEAGLPEAEVLLASALDHPARTDRQPQEAFKLLQKLTRDGNQPAAVSLSQYLLEGRGTDSADPARAFALLKQASDAEETTSYFPLGELYEKGLGTGIAPNSKLALETYQKALAAGDRRAATKFTIADDAKKMVLDFVESWHDSDPNVSLAFLAAAPAGIFAMHTPDLTNVEVYERGFRCLWPTRRFVPVAAKVHSEILALDEVQIDFPASFHLSRPGGYEATGGMEIHAVAKMVENSWKIVSFEEKITAPDSLIAKNPQSLRQILPEKKDLDSSANIPPRLKKVAASLSIQDRFGLEYQRIPTDVRENCVVLTDSALGGDVLVPILWFDTSAISKIRDSLGGGITHRFDEMLNAIQVEPNWNDPAAAKLKKAAEQGDPEAMALIGEHFYDGLGAFPVDRIEAVRWFAKAAQNRNPLGRVWLGIMTSNGEIESNDRAEKILRGAIPDLAIAIASRTTNPSYFRATAEARAIVEPSHWNETLARELLERAVQKNEPRALLIKADTQYANSPDLRAQTYLRAEVAGSTIAAIRLGEHYIKSASFPTEQFRLFKKAALKGSPAGHLYLSICYEKGIGTEVNSAAAAFYGQLAVLSASEFKLTEIEQSARENLARLERSENGDDIFRAREFFESALDTKLTLSPGSQSIPSTRAWRTLTGHKIQSDFITIESDAVTFRPANGTEFSIPLELLNDSDADFAKRQKTIR